MSIASSFLSSMREFSLLSNSSWNLLLLAQVIGPSMLSPPKPKSSSLDSPLSRSNIKLLFHESYLPFFLCEKPFWFRQSSTQKKSKEHFCPLSLSQQKNNSEKTKVCGPFFAFVSEHATSDLILDGEKSYTKISVLKSSVVTFLKAIRRGSMQRLKHETILQSIWKKVVEILNGRYNCIFLERNNIMLVELNLYSIQIFVCESQEQLINKKYFSVLRFRRSLRACQ